MYSVYNSKSDCTFEPLSVFLQMTPAEPYSLFISIIFYSMCSSLLSTLFKSFHDNSSHKHVCCITSARLGLYSALPRDTPMKGLVIGERIKPGAYLL